MEIICMNEEQSGLYSEQISRLLWDVLKTNVPQASYTLEDCIKKTSELLCFLKEGKAIFIVAMEDEIIGFIWAYPRMNGNQARLHLNHIVVKESYRQNKIGSILLEHLEKYAATHHFEAIELLATTENLATIHFYEKNYYVVERMQYVKRIRSSGL